MFAQIMLWMKSLGLSEEAQGLAEYALILVLIAAVVFGVLTILGVRIQTIFTQITAALGGG